MISFSFGKNWLSYVSRMTEDDVRHAIGDIDSMLGAENVRGKTVVDIGSGSGIHSLAFHRLGAESLASYDVDPHSVQATRTLWEREGRPNNWTVNCSSILDDRWAREIGRFQIVYSWGVLHHTGAMWHAIDNAAALVAPGGLFWIALYTKGSQYAEHLALKQKYNAASTPMKRAMELRHIARLIYGEVRQGRNPLGWNKRTTRGMNTYIDIVDWLGGLPYEVASADEIVVHLRRKGFIAERVVTLGEGSCSSYVFRRENVVD